MLYGVNAMAREPYDRYLDEMQEEQPPQRPHKPKRHGLPRQSIMLLGSVAIAALLLVSVIVMAFGNLVGGGKPATSNIVPPSGASGLPDASGGSDMSQVVPENTGADPAAWNLALVSDAHPVDASYQVAELNTIIQYVTGGAVEYYFDARIVDTLNQMLTDCNAQAGHSLRIIAGYRSYNKQNELYTYYYNNYKAMGLSEGDAVAAARQYALPAGAAENITGLAVSFVTGDSNEASDSFAQTGEFTWLMQNCAKYGFVLRYAQEKESVTGVQYKPYHFRYVGVAEAEYMTANGLCLEEYVAGAAQQPTAGEPAAA